MPSSTTVLFRVGKKPWGASGSITFEVPVTGDLLVDCLVLTTQIGLMKKTVMAAAAIEIKKFFQILGLGSEIP